MGFTAWVGGWVTHSSDGEGAGPGVFCIRLLCRGTRGDTLEPGAGVPALADEKESSWDKTSRSVVTTTGDLSSRWFMT